MRVLLIIALVLPQAACAVAALPFRVAADVADVVPVVGGIVAAPLEATADVID